MRRRTHRPDSHSVHFFFLRLNSEYRVYGQTYFHKMIFSFSSSPPATVCGCAGDATRRHIYFILIQKYTFFPFHPHAYTWKDECFVITHLKRVSHHPCTMSSALSALQLMLVVCTDTHAYRTHTPNDQKKANKHCGCCGIVRYLQKSWKVNPFEFDCHERGDMPCMHKAKARHQKRAKPCSFFFYFVNFPVISLHLLWCSMFSFGIDCVAIRANRKFFSFAAWLLLFINFRISFIFVYIVIYSFVVYSACELLLQLQ